MLLPMQTKSVHEEECKRLKIDPDRVESIEEAENGAVVTMASGNSFLIFGQYDAVCKEIDAHRTIQ